MGRPRKGCVFEHGDHFDARITLPGGSRSRPICLPQGMTEAKARERALEMTELARAEALPHSHTGAGMASTGTASDAPETVEAWSTRWCDAREARGLTSVDDDRGRLRKWVLPKLGPRAITTITRTDLEALVEDLDSRVRAEELSWKTALNVWGLLSKMFDDACNGKQLALRVLTTDPASGVRGPDRGTKKSKVYLYPSELLKLVSCERVPIRWRRLFSITTYLYLRAAEVRGLDWGDFDLEHRLVFIHRTVDDSGAERSTKGEESRRVPIEPTLLPLLHAMKEEAQGVGRVIDRMPPEEDLAQKLRHWLGRAGVTRAELFASDRTRRQLRFHDLRATGITWRAIRGDDPLKIMKAAGHKDFATTMAYVRDAEQVSDGFGSVFAPLPESLSSLNLDVGLSLWPSGIAAGPSPAPAKGVSSDESSEDRFVFPQTLRTTHSLLAIPAGIEPALPA